MANHGRNIVAIQEDQTGGIKAYWQHESNPRHSRLVSPINARLLSGQCSHPIKRATVQKVPSQLKRNGCRHGPFATRSGAIDGQHGHRCTQRLSNGRQPIEEIRKSLGHTRGLQDIHRNARAQPAGKRGQRQAHRHPMIVVGRNRRGNQGGRGVYPKPIGSLIDTGAEFAQFGRHRRDTVGFFDPPRSDSAQKRCTLSM